jgi:hypothetical protein
MSYLLDASVDDDVACVAAVDVAVLLPVALAAYTGAARVAVDATRPA